MYRISNRHGLAFVGSTFLTLDEKIQEHWMNYNAWKQGHGDWSSCFAILAGQHRLEVVELVPDATPSDLLAREVYHNRKKHYIDEVASVEATDGSDA